jgi:hypothetical protein
MSSVDAQANDAHQRVYVTPMHAQANQAQGTKFFLHAVDKTMGDTLAMKNDRTVNFS